MDDEQDYTEIMMNDGIKQSELPTMCSTNEYQLLVVAAKYQMWGDEPLLDTDVRE